MKKQLITGLVVSLIISGYSQSILAAQKIRGQAVGINILQNEYRNPAPRLPGDSQNFKFSYGVGFGFVSDYFLGDSKNHALSFDFYLQTASDEEEGEILTTEITDDRYTCSALSGTSACRTEIERVVSNIRFLLGYRYHFSGYDKSTGYLGAALSLNRVDIISSRTVYEPPRDADYDEGILSATGISPAVTGGYEWRVSKNNGLIMGIHMLWTPPADYSTEVADLGGLSIGYTIGGIIRPK